MQADWLQLNTWKMIIAQPDIRIEPVLRRS